MVKSLRQLCLANLSQNLDKSVNQDLRLPPGTKEELLHRLVNHDQLSVQFLPAITYNLVTHKLQHLDFCRSYQIDDNFLFHIGLVRCNLRSVRITRCGKITDKGILELLINQFCLECLELRYLSIDGTCLKFVNCPETLKRLNVKGCSAMDGTFVETCCAHNRNIEYLNVRGIRSLKNSTVRSIASKLGGKLRNVNLSACTNVGADAVLALAELCPNVTCVKLGECMNVPEEALKLLMISCLKLSKLDLSYCSRFDNGFSEALMRVLPKGLVSLKLCGVQTTVSPDVAISTFADLIQLTSLNLSAFGALSDEFLSGILEKIGPKLSELDLGGSFEKITDLGIGAVALHCPNLSFLSLNLLHRMSLIKLLPVFRDSVRAEKFRTLRMANCASVDISLLEAISQNCRNLRFLDISGIVNPALDDHIMCRLALTCGKNLNTLFLRANRGISDVSLVNVACACPNLQCISLSGICRVSDKSILALANHCYFLREVYLSGCVMISKAAINYLQDESYNRVTVYHVVPNAHDTTVLVAKNLDTGEYCRVY